MKSRIEIPVSITNMDKTILQAIKSGVNDCVDDLLRVASLRTPVDSTTLEKSGTSKISVDNNSISGAVSFKAMNKNYNYAIKMDRGNYKLGKKSLKKSSGGVRSKFSKSTLRVGKGFLSDTANKCSDGYKKHIDTKIKEALSKDNFKVK